jgi:hypothetical protein
VRAVKGERAGENFIAITDPGTAMEQRAREHRFRHIFLNPPEIGGRYSALSYFGLVPAALMGIDVGRLLESAQRMRRACGPVVPPDDNPGLLLGAALGSLARAGRDKLTLWASGKMATFGYWVEQLIAESTGKDGLGILPVEGERPGPAKVYGRDRVFVYLRLDGRLDRAVAALARAGQPVVELRLKDRYDLGGEFLRWEVATAAAGFVLGIDPFDQPNVQESKDNTVRLLKEHAAQGRLPAASHTLPAADAGLGAALLQHLRAARRGDYVALTAYVERTPRREKLLRELQAAIRDRFGLPATVGYGPRFLHSTGQLHKGGANNGVFVQFVADDPDDVQVPGEAYTFGVLKQAQALGDFQALEAHGRRALRVDLDGAIEAGLRRALQAVEASRPVARRPARKAAGKGARKTTRPVRTNGARRGEVEKKTRARA